MSRRSVRSRGAAGNVTSANGRRSGPRRPQAAGPRSRRDPVAGCCFPDDTATLRRWGGQGPIPQYDGAWTPAAVGPGRVVVRMCERGHSLQEIRRASAEGRLAFGFLEGLFPSEEVRYTVEQAARVTGLVARQRAQE